MIFTSVKQVVLKEKEGVGLEPQLSGCSSRGYEFSSQEPRGGSQPRIMGSDSLFCQADVQEDGALIYISK